MSQMDTDSTDTKSLKEGASVRPVKYELNRRRLVKRASERREKMIAFGYYGGKFSHLDFLLPLLPVTYAHYCEPYGGSAAVLINRRPADVETYNDLDAEVTNFFFCLRTHGDELSRQISLTPFSREELVLANTPQAGLVNLEQARTSRSTALRRVILWATSLS